MQLKRRPTPDVMQIDALYQKNGRTLLAFVRRQVGSLEEAEDIVLDIFVAALESEILSSLDAEGQQAWLRRVARNKCVDYHRRVIRRPAVSLETVTESIYDDDEREPGRVAIQQEEAMLLRKLLTLLTEQQREVLQLKFGYNLRSPEIAARINKSESAVRMMLARTLNFLRNIYMNNEERREQ